MITNAAAEATQNPLLPEVYDIVWSTLCFVIILLFFWKYVLPRVQKMLDERSEKIEGGIEQAQSAKNEAVAALEQYNAQLAEARGEAAKIRETARAEGAAILAQLKTDAQAEAQRISAAATAQIDADRRAAFKELKNEIGVLAVDLASSVIGESLTDDARSKAVVDRFVAELDESSKAGAAE